ncbi:ABC transporter permease [Romboutsia weinsteinii]|uniref:ABC transporter permease n=1 Tax=Romboutsia weinsteinii TaxID=2020949 RepID=A0A371IY98_9FIRM|nr:oligopeptide ABC transporter permease [Romboutsia weinsteinii]RDY25461.1 ABC transporter permease [Romboutsia weinsteinii]
MLDKVVVDGNEVLLTEDMFTLDSIDSKESEAITRPSLTFWQDARKRLFKNKGAVVGLVILTFIVLMAAFAPILSKFTYDKQNLYHAKVPPKFPIVSSLGVMDGRASLDGKDVYAEKNIEETYLFGTDALGRDIWTRVWTGARVSLFIALIAATFDLLIGVTYGGISAYYGGRVDIIMQRIIEVITGIPSLVILTLFIMVFDPGILSMALAMAISGWTGMARVVRSHVLRLKNQEFVLASKTLGSSDIKLIKKHLLPNVIGQIVVMIMFTLPSAIFYEAFLSFIGLGLQPPNASLGVLINDGFKSFQTHPYMMLIPSVVICLLIFSLNLLADGLRDAVDPKMRNQ